MPGSVLVAADKGICSRLQFKNDEKALGRPGLIQALGFERLQRPPRFIRLSRGTAAPSQVLTPGAVGGPFPSPFYVVYSVKKVSCIAGM